MNFLKRKLPLLIVFFTGTLIIISNYVPHDPFNQILEGASSWYQIIAGFTLVIGVSSLIRSHYRKVKIGKQGWGYSLVMFIMMVITAVFGILPQEWGVDSGWGGIFGNESGSVFMWIFEFVNQAAAATVFSLLAFYIASAAYRAFRVRTIDATIMLITAVIVMIGRTPLGDWMSKKVTQDLASPLAYLRLDKMTLFFLNYPTVAAKRAIFLGLALAMAATALRVILGIERTYMGGED